ncbi:MAG: glycosyltransferase, partial [Acidobacteriota bacterium]
MTRTPPRIGLMLRTWSERGGVGVYTRNLVRELLAVERAAERTDEEPIEWVLLWRRAADRRDVAPTLDLASVEQHVVRAPSLPLLGKLMWDQVAVPWAAWRLGLDVILNAKFTAPFGAPCSVVMTVHGADWWDPDEARFYGRLDTAYIRTVMPWYFRRCAAVVSVSEQSTRGFVRALGRLAESRLRTVPFGPASHFAPIDDPVRIAAVAERYGLPARYLLTLGKPSAWERKNLDGLVAAYRRYAQRVEMPLPLVVGGPEPERLRAALRVGLDEPGFVFPGWIEQADLPAVHAGAAVFVYPSHLEAF